ncbi:hypothetical protein L9F63_017780 [Diploptera punctata]|uniref:Protein sleepless n=1 Tax=Diploptera punctata TaxID=6984 RepID=A0AAD7ZZ82_DIPPU|nr:hypothetical protein L9F63_017780 [Diploptera punctata]
MTLRCTTVQRDHQHRKMKLFGCVSHFDGSSLYEKDCPYSTFCLKKTYELTLLNGEVVKGAERSCAPQLYNYQTYDGTQWRQKNKIEDTAYSEGCFPAETQGIKSPATEHCYCSGNLCNSAKPSREPPHHHTDAMAVIFVFNAMKYIRSLR